MEGIEPPTSIVRQNVLATLRALGGGEGECSEVVLVKDRLFFGRRFCRGGLQAIWIAGEGHFSVFNEAGDTIARCPLTEAATASRRAA